MSFPPPLTIRAAFVGVLLVTSPLGAQAWTVSRCNQLSDGVYRPVLVVQHDGTTTVHHLGEDGLTRSILFDPKAALSWAEARYGAEGVTGTACGHAPDGGDDDDDDDDCGGGGCGAF